MTEEETVAEQEVEALPLDSIFVCFSPKIEADVVAEFKESLKPLGGNVVGTVTKKCTHYIATADEWKQKTPNKSRMALDRKDVKIVSTEYLEISIKNKTPADESKYLLDTTRDEQENGSRSSVSRGGRERKPVSSYANEDSPSENENDYIDYPASKKGTPKRGKGTPRKRNSTSKKRKKAHDEDNETGSEEDNDVVRSPKAGTRTSKRTKKSVEESDKMDVASPEKETERGTSKSPEKSAAKEKSASPEKTGTKRKSMSPEKVSKALSKSPEKETPSSKKAKSPEKDITAKEKSKSPEKETTKTVRAKSKSPEKEVTNTTKAKSPEKNTPVMKKAKSKSPEKETQKVTSPQKEGTRANSKSPEKESTKVSMKG
ncbi:hypothetical protein HK099_006564, partial [Clydaea vesicula]